MRGQISAVFCDGHDCLCGEWDVDYYEQTASSVGGVRITASERAPGWVSTDMTDYCPSCAAQGKGTP